ncbi:gamma-aminobutyric acid type B receptor subunit 1-like [Saccoglossus kowalevskii]
MGLLPFNGAWSGGDAQLVSMNMALEEVNTREDILPGYRLQLIYNDTECNVATGVNQMFQMLYTPPIKIMILGAGCSFVSEATAQTSHQWNLNQLSYASVSPSLSDKTRFPRFLRMSTPETAHNPARVKILESFKWKKVASIHQSLELFAKLTENLLERLQTANITILTSEIFVYDPAVHVRHLKELDARIIFGNFYVDVARRVFCEAYKQGLYGAKHVWIIQGWYEADWWKIKDENIVCTVDQLSEAVKGYLTTDTFYLDPDNSMGISGMTPDDYQTEFNIRGGEETYASRLAPQGYDAVWAAALALNATAEDLAETGESLGEFTYDDEYIADMILNNIRSLEFQGIKGPVSFDENGDPRSVSKILQLQDGKRITVGIARPSEEIRWLQDSPIIWEAGRPPVDGKKVTILPVRITLSLYVPMCVLSGVGIMLAMALLSFNVLNRENSVSLVVSGSATSFIHGKFVHRIQDSLSLTADSSGDQDDSPPLLQVFSRESIQLFA